MNSPRNTTPDAPRGGPETLHNLPVIPLSPGTMFLVEHAERGVIAKLAYRADSKGFDLYTREEGARDFFLKHKIDLVQDTDGSGDKPITIEENCLFNLEVNGHFYVITIDVCDFQRLGSKHVVFGDVPSSLWIRDNQRVQRWLGSLAQVLKLTSKELRSAYLS